MPPPDRALRRLVADLGDMNPEDRADILAALSPAERAAISRLLSAGEKDGWTTGLSPWLAGRARDGADPTPLGFAGHLEHRSSSRVSPVARDALRAAIKTMDSDVAAPSGDVVERSAGWLSRLLSRRTSAP